MQKNILLFKVFFLINKYRECQKNDWKEHKIYCNDVKNDYKVSRVSLADFFTDDNIPVTIVENEEKGRFLIAKRNILKGSLVLAGDCYSTILNDDINDQCPSCYMKLDNSNEMIKCEKCNKDCYCKDYCKKLCEEDHNVLFIIYS